MGLVVHEALLPIYPVLFPLLSERETLIADTNRDWIAPASRYVISPIFVQHILW